MAIFGVVCEFNPFHNGHKYLLDEAHRLGADKIVCVMSGNSTQRGELALCDKYYRAEMAVRGGADLVLELPYPFCSASAEFFAFGAISVLSEFCDTVIFGSECGDVDMLRKCAELASGENFKKKYSEMLEGGEQSAYAFSSMIEEKLGYSLASNDILGVEYIKAAKRMGATIDFLTVKRKGSGYLCEALDEEQGGFSSAMAIRRAIDDGNLAILDGELPSCSCEILKKALICGDIIEIQKYREAARFFFRVVKPESLYQIAEMSEGLAERICNKAHESTSGTDFFESISTKRFTDAKLRRAMLFAMTDVRSGDLRAPVEYTLVLGANKAGRELLSLKRRDEMDIKVITKSADISAERGSELLHNLDSIYTFCLKESRSTGDIVRKKSYIT